MSDSRKWLIALAALALLVAIGTPAMAQPGASNGFSCTVQSGTPVIVRTEGITELLGDLLMQCTGGIPTLAGKPIPQTNITYTLNTNITSRLLGSGFIDALLLLDEPYPAPLSSQNPPEPVRVGPANPITGAKPYIPQSVCAPTTSDTASFTIATNGLGGTYTSPAHCNVEFGTFNGILPGLPGAAPSPYSTQANVFVAQQTGANQVTWLGVPVDAPGTAGFRQIRVTNVRGNACQLGLSSTLIPTQIVAFLSVTGQQLFTIGNPQQTVAFIQTGLIVSGQNTSVDQCNNLNVGGGGVGGNFFGGSQVGIGVTRVVVTEGFAQSFKRRNVPDLSVEAYDGAGIAHGVIPLGGVAEGNQNVPGVAYNTESGLSAANLGFGQADSATRILIRMNNVGAGVRLIFPIAVVLTSVPNTAVGGVPGSPDNITGLNSAVAGWTGGFLQLRAVSSDLSGNLPSNFGGFVSGTTSFSNSSFFFSSGPFKGPGAIPPFNQGAEAGVVGGTAVALYEVVNDDPALQETASIPIGVAFVSNTAQNLPPPGTTTANVSFAPLSTVGTASSGAPIPRFCDNSTARSEFTIQVCRCDLLFPFVSNQAGFETGIAIANTSVDPFGTTPQNGTVQLNYYGNTPGNGPAPAAQTSQTVLAGTELIFTLSGGGNYGIDARAAGFQGYIIAIANFQWCHAFAFINDTHSSLSEGYLAIQLDIYAGSGLNRTGVVGEVQSH